MKEIALNGKRGGIALVDDADYERVAAHTWYAHVNPRAQAVYARARINGKWIMMHRLILGFPSLDVDHDNGSGLDNRRANLIVKTRAENAMNRPRQLGNRGARSRFRGVGSRAKCGGKLWSAHYRGSYLGCFNEEESAARAYDAAARFEGRTQLNFPEVQP